MPRRLQGQPCGLFRGLSGHHAGGGQLLQDKILGNGKRQGPVPSQHGYFFEPVPTRSSSLVEGSTRYYLQHGSVRDLSQQVLGSDYQRRFGRRESLLLAPAHCPRLDEGTRAKAAIYSLCLFATQLGVPNGHRGSFRWARCRSHCRRHARLEGCRRGRCQGQDASRKGRGIGIFDGCSKGCLCGGHVCCRTGASGGGSPSRYRGGSFPV
mmetsp:Transcript_18735/g.46531  ORF Transcript_18735/g.46531 Transcript_18735/m.46531 type:complete len:209 (-) Transcript_18735:2-628(-)